MSPVDALSPNSKGFYDVFGNAWEWTLDKFCALPGFEVHPLYEDFSTPCFDGLHNVIQGGSFISTGDQASRFARYHFRPHFHQHASFRVVEQAPELLITSDTDAPGPYVGSYPFRRSAQGLADLYDAAGVDTQSPVNSMLLKHFGSLCTANASPLLENFGDISQLSDLVLEHAAALQIDLGAANAIEVGCGPGRVSFELAKHLRSVVGVDHSSDLVEVARKLLGGRESVQVTLGGEGDLHQVLTVPAPTNISERVEFRYADPMCLPAEMSGFDVAVLHDVLDKVSSPNAVLGRLGGVRGLVRSGGLLVVASCYRWNSSTTPQPLWLGGFTDKNGVEIRSEDTLVSRLSEDFLQLRSVQVPVLWRESQSDVHGKVYTVTLFQRK